LVFREGMSKEREVKVSGRFGRRTSRNEKSKERENGRRRSPIDGKRKERRRHAKKERSLRLRPTFSARGEMKPKEAKEMNLTTDTRAHWLIGRREGGDRRNSIHKRVGDFEESNIGKRGVQSFRRGHKKASGS